MVGYQGSKASAISAASVSGISGDIKVKLSKMANTDAQNQDGSQRGENHDPNSEMDESEDCSEADEMDQNYDETEQNENIVDRDSNNIQEKNSQFNLMHYFKKTDKSPLETEEHVPQNKIQVSHYMAQKVQTSKNTGGKNLSADLTQSSGGDNSSYPQFAQYNQKHKKYKW